MKGIVFTELIDMIEGSFGLDAADRVLTASKVASGGAYTSVGIYDHREAVQLVVALATETGMPPADLLRGFGRHLFGRFVVLYPQLFAQISSPLEFLDRLDGYIHVEVRKLYPEAELPRFETRWNGERELHMLYRSPRPFADLAQGLIEGCFEHFGHELLLSRGEETDAAGGRVHFTVRLGERIAPCRT